MILDATQILALAPLIVVTLTAVAVMLAVSWRRHHFFNATLTVVGEGVDGYARAVRELVAHLEGR